MVDFPTTAPVFPTLQDDIDWILAAHQNVPNLEINAMATMIGPLGVAQGYSTDLVGFLNAVIPTIRLTWIDVNTVQASAGRINCINAGETKRVFRRNTSTTNITFANIDTGARATNTTYYIWAIADAVSTAVTFLISASASAPTGALVFALVGGFATDATGSGNIIEKSLWSLKGIQIVDIQYDQDGATASGAVTIPHDDTVPQISEGLEVLSIEKFCAKNVNNLLLILCVATGNASSSTNLVSALFKDTTADAISAINVETGGSGDLAHLIIGHFRLAGTLSAQRFSNRIGGGSGTTYFNGDSGGRLLGGVFASFMVVIEFSLEPGT